MKRKKIEINTIIPFLSLAILMILFTITSGGKMMSPFNIQVILDQTMIVIIGGIGALFVIALGSVDLTIGVNLAMSALLGSIVADLTGIGVLLIPTCLISGIVIGFLAGTVSSRFKMPSFMVGLATLIGLRGIVNYIMQTGFRVQYLPSNLKWMGDFWVKLVIVAALFAIGLYVFEYTRLGQYCKAVGENENAAIFTGISAKKIRVLAFTISGLLAGIAAIFTLVKTGGTSTTMGVFFEMQVLMAVYLGGVLVTGGASARMYKMLIGSLSITIIDNGLVLAGYSSSEISEAVKGVFLMLILFFTIYFSDEARVSRMKKLDTK